MKIELSFANQITIDIETSEAGKRLRYAEEFRISVSEDNFCTFSRAQGRAKCRVSSD